MKVDERTWKGVQEHLGFNDEEMKKFRENPRNEDVLSKTAVMVNKTIVAEIIESHGCDSGHKVGDKIYFDGRGVSLLTKLGPSKICIFALHSVALAIPALAELLYAGINPNEMRFKRFGCPDVGIKCGGWGHIVMELSMEDRDKLGK
ncbi:MAG: TIGR04076 family protein [Deltaproteobacteria bacterium]|nr:TIGR04076 family protein [Deltaproteobacteria bacterium]